MFAIASKILICLLLVALLGFFIGYLFGKMQKCKEKKDDDENVVKYYPKTPTLHDSTNKTKTRETKDSKKRTSTHTKPSTANKEDITPDDLKKIKGIGVKIEGALNKLGIYTFSQIASWSEENIAWVDEHLVFKGRAKREEWIEQAKKLSSGEDTEFSKNYKKR